VRIESDGDFEAFVALAAPDLSRLARLLSSDPAAAEDLLQSTFLRVWRSWPKVRVATDRQAYVRRVMVNTASSGWRRRWRSEIPTYRLPETPIGDVGNRIVERDWLVRAVRSLPNRQRAAIVLRYFLDLDDAAIADLLGCSVSTVRSQISRALVGLRVSTSDPGVVRKQPTTGERTP
jgi:RNA polymerase sigma-70 factor (sigma-E family)